MSTNPIVIINGKSVYSNKTVSCVIDSVVYFHDGSWCNVDNGEVVNNGVGYINIGNPSSPSQAEKVKKEPKSYTATALELKNLPADVEVFVGGNQIVVSIEGPANVLGGINVSLEEGTLIIEGSSSSNNSSSTSKNIFASDGNIVIGNNTFITDNNSDVINTKILITVPLHTEITMNDVKGATKIGNTEGDLYAKIADVSSVIVGHLRNAGLIVNESGSIVMREVTENANIIVSSSGDAVILSGQTNALIAKVSGFGDIHHFGTVVTSHLTASESGDILVNNVINSPIKKVSDSGSIRIG